MASERAKDLGAAACSFAMAGRFVCTGEGQRAAVGFVSSGPRAPGTGCEGARGGRRPRQLNDRPATLLFHPPQKRPISLTCPADPTKRWQCKRAGSASLIHCPS
eukprot:360309-Chlamydomonas_euryale.AAC.3